MIFNVFVQVLVSSIRHLFRMINGTVAKCCEVVCDV